MGQAEETQVMVVLEGGGRIPEALAIAAIRVEVVELIARWHGEEPVAMGKLNAYIYYRDAGGRLRDHGVQMPFRTIVAGHGGARGALTARVIRVDNDYEFDPFDRSLFQRITLILGIRSASSEPAPTTPALPGPTSAEPASAARARAGDDAGTDSRESAPAATPIAAPDDSAAVAPTAPSSGPDGAGRETAPADDAAPLAEPGAAAEAEGEVITAGDAPSPEEGDAPGALIEQPAEAVPTPAAAAAHSDETPPPPPAEPASPQGPAPKEREVIVWKPFPKE
ncbi:MAG TPA: hypothetical protein VF234_02995 [Limnochordia bacterium]